jgi:hypothetical protein
VLVVSRKSRTNEARKRIVIVSLFFLGIDGVIGGGQIGQGLAMSDVTGWGGADTIAASRPRWRIVMAKSGQPTSIGCDFMLNPQDNLSGMR